MCIFRNMEPLNGRQVCDALFTFLHTGPILFEKGSSLKGKTFFPLSVDTFPEGGKRSLTGYINSA